MSFSYLVRKIREKQDEPERVARANRQYLEKPSDHGHQVHVAQTRGLDYSILRAARWLRRRLTRSAE